METKLISACAICGREATRYEQWFLVVANRWRDTLKVLDWDDHLAAQAGVQHLCCSTHVQELVVHWMITGSVAFPFARVSTPLAAAELAAFLPSLPDDADDVDTTGLQALGELSVHRESMQRILRDSPHSLASILEALVSALERGPGAVSQNEESEEELELCAIGRQV